LFPAERDSSDRTWSTCSWQICARPRFGSSIISAPAAGCVYHLAANPDARWGIENTRLDLDQEAIATYNVLEAMRLNQCKRILLSSSGTV